MTPDSKDLQISVQEPARWSRRLSITVPRERVQRTRDRVTSQLAKRVNLPGFRKGKLPSRLMEQRFGPAIEQETLDQLIQDAYREALTSQGFTPINQGKVDNVEYARDADLKFEVEFEIRPEYEIERVSGFTASRTSTEVGDDEVDAVLERLRDDRAVWRPLEEGTKPDYGDQVMVDITVLDPDGAPKEDEEPRSYRFALGEGQAIPMVEEAIMTLAPGEEGKFEVKFPEDFPDEAQRGVEQHLQIRLTEARRKELPELDDEFATSVGDFETMEALRTRILDDLKEDADRRAEADVRRQLVDQVIEANPLEVPNSMVERYLDYMTGHSHAEGEGEKHQHTPEEEERISQMRDSLRPEAEWSLKRMLVIEKLAEREDLRATQDEIDARVEELAEKVERSPSEVWLQLEKSGQLEALEREITEDKVFDYLKAQNAVQE